MPFTPTQESMPAQVLIARLRAWLLVVVLAWPLGTTAVAAPPVDPHSAVLHLANGGFVSGSLVASSEPDRIRWESAAFTAPFDLALKSVTAIHYSVPAELPKPGGEYCFEL